MKDRSITKRIAALILTFALCFSLIPATSLAAAPSAPKGFKGAALSTSSIKLTWKKVSKAKSYTIYRKSGSKYVKLVTLSSKYSSYTVKKLKAGTKYYYKIAVKTSKGTSKMSPAVGVKTKARVTSTPTPVSTPAPTDRILNEQEKKFVGVWWLNTENDPITGLSTRHFWYEFKSDGTFFFSLTEDGSYVVKDIQSQTGNFRVDGDTLYYTNVKGTKIHGAKTEYENKPMDDYSQTFRFFSGSYDRESLTIGTLDVYKKVS